MDMDSKENAAPQLYEKMTARESAATDYDDTVVDKIDNREVFDLIRTINDPEHPRTLEELHVVRQEHIEVDDDASYCRVQFTPTIPHCSMATLIGLCIRVRLLRSLPARYKVDVEIYPDTHVSRDAVNKQLADKERVAAAIERGNLLDVVNQCLSARA
eukprot:m.42708 g.42708  ORF g.42708 m.42708 type:complete len:158 (+) comp12129_c0_seq1:69-542(+)